MELFLTKHGSSLKRATLSTPTVQSQSKLTLGRFSSAPVYIPVFHNQAVAKSSRGATIRPLLILDVAKCSVEVHQCRTPGPPGGAEPSMTADPQDGQSRNHVATTAALPVSASRGPARGAASSYIITPPPPPPHSPSSSLSNQKASPHAQLAS